MNILIAEDNPVIQMLHCELMKKWGYDYDMASNGLEAVEYAKKNNGEYDLCLMDIEMPVMNGIEATKIIRKTVNYFPIMAFTSNDGYKRDCQKSRGQVLKITGSGLTIIHSPLLRLNHHRLIKAELSTRCRIVRFRACPCHCTIPFQMANPVFVRFAKIELLRWLEISSSQACKRS